MFAVQLVVLYTLPFGNFRLFKLVVKLQPSKQHAMCLIYVHSALVNDMSHAVFTRYI